MRPRAADLSPTSVRAFSKARSLGCWWGALWLCPPERGRARSSCQLPRPAYVLALPRLAKRLRMGEALRTPGARAAAGSARRGWRGEPPAEVGIRLNADELRAVDQGVEESCDFGAAFRA